MPSVLNIVKMYVACMVHLIVCLPPSIMGVCFYPRAVIGSRLLRTRLHGPERTNQSKQCFQWVCTNMPRDNKLTFGRKKKRKQPSCSGVFRVIIGNYGSSRWPAGLESSASHVSS